MKRKMSRDDDGEGVRASLNDSSTSSELENGQIQPKDPKLSAYPHGWFVLGTPSDFHFT